MMVLFPMAFVSAISYPRMVSMLLSVYLVGRVTHISSWMSNRGHNKAWANEEFLKIILIQLLFLGLMSSVRITGVLKPLTSVVGNLRIVKRLTKKP